MTLSFKNVLILGTLLCFGATLVGYGLEERIFGALIGFGLGLAFVSLLTLCNILDKQK